MTAGSAATPASSYRMLPCRYSSAPHGVRTRVSRPRSSRTYTAGRYWMKSGWKHIVYAPTFA